MSFNDLLTMHRHFIIKPNPYITTEQASSANQKLVLSEAATFLSLLSLSLSLLKIKPNITLNSAYKKFNLVQFLVAGALGLAYGYDLWKLRAFVPEREF